MTPKDFLCKKCLVKMNEYDATRKKEWRRIKKLEAREIKSKVEKVNIKN